jgi:hypothetical protein
MGAAGPSGTAGSAGVSVTTTVEPPGANCPNGGVQLTSASGTSYVCNGASPTPSPAAADVANTVVARDGTGSFAADNLSLDGNLYLPSSTATVGNIYKGGALFMSGNAASNNTSLGANAGNLTMTGDGNTAIGGNALQSNLDGSGDTAVGDGAMRSNTHGSNNTAVGLVALNLNSTGHQNTAVGEEALTLNTGGSYNTAVGMQALYRNTTDNNTAFGCEALNNNTTGTFNTASGGFALDTNSSGNQNTALGYAALFSSNANDNTAVGYDALAGNVAGASNTAVGSTALQHATGSSNIGIGQGAGKTLTTGSNNIYIGIDTATATESNVTRIANISGVTVSGVNVLVSSSGQLGVASSSRTYKENIHDMAGESDVLMSLRPVSFKYKKAYDARQSQQYGLVAEEVARVATDLVEYRADGRPDTVRYQLVNAMLLNEVQKQHKRLADQQARIDALEAHLASACRAAAHQVQ